MAKKKEQANLYLLAIVAIVAVVGIVVLVLNVGGPASMAEELVTIYDEDGDLVGEAYVSGSVWKRFLERQTGEEWLEKQIKLQGADALISIPEGKAVNCGDGGPCTYFCYKEKCCQTCDCSY